MLMPFMLAPIIIVSFLASALIVSGRYNLLGIEYGSRRIGFIDGLRGIACVLVVCAHAKWVGSFGISNKELTSFNYFFHVNMGSVGVQIFFCITGMLFFTKVIRSGGVIDVREFYVSRLYRLAPLYVFWSIVVVFACLLIGGLNVSMSDPKEILRLLSFGFSGGDFTLFGVRTRDFTTVIWSLAYEWKFYFVIPAIASVYAARHSVAPISAFVCIAIIADLLITGSSYVIYFMVGGAASVVYLRGPEINAPLRRILSILALSLIAVCIYVELPQYGFVRFILISAAFLSLVVSRPGVLSAKPLVVLGEISYSVYLFHTLIIYLFSKMSKEYLYPLDSVALIVLVYALLSFSVFVVSSLTFRFIESPYMKRGKVVARDACIYPVGAGSRPA